MEPIYLTDIKEWISKAELKAEQLKSRLNLTELNDEILSFINSHKQGADDSLNDLIQYSKLPRGQAEPDGYKYLVSDIKRYLNDYIKYLQLSLPDRFIDIIKTIKKADTGWKTTLILGTYFIYILGLIKASTPNTINLLEKLKDELGFGELGARFYEIRNAPVPKYIQEEDVKKLQLIREYNKKVDEYNDEIDAIQEAKALAKAQAKAAKEEAKAQAKAEKALAKAQAKASKEEAKAQAKAAKKSARISQPKLQQQFSPTSVAIELI